MMQHHHMIRHGCDGIPGRRPLPLLARNWFGVAWHFAIILNHFFERNGQRVKHKFTVIYSMWPWLKFQYCNRTISEIVLFQILSLAWKRFCVSFICDIQQIGTGGREGTCNNPGNQQCGSYSPAKETTWLLQPKKALTARQGSYSHNTSFQTSLLAGSQEMAGGP